jgi:TetR/AcrR family transcriptional repressor of mexJK operon
MSLGCGGQFSIGSPPYYLVRLRSCTWWVGLSTAPVVGRSPIHSIDISATLGFFVPLAADNPTSGWRQAQRTKRRDAILTVASKSFLDHGYAGTTMSAIAAELGGSKGTLWSYFPSKELLFEAVIDCRTTIFRTMLIDILAPEDDLISMLRRFCTGLLVRATSPDAIALFRLVVAETGRFPEIGRIFYQRASRSTEEVLAGALQRAMDRGELLPSDPLGAAELLTGLCRSGSHRRLVMGDIAAATPELIAADVERALRMFLRAQAPSDALR